MLAVKRERGTELMHETFFFVGVSAVCVSVVVEYRGVAIHFSHRHRWIISFIFMTFLAQQYINIYCCALANPFKDLDFHILAVDVIIYSQMEKYWRQTSFRTLELQNDFGWDSNILSKEICFAVTVYCKLNHEVCR